MKDNFLKLGILGGRDVPFDTSQFKANMAWMVLG
jgi:hypothetical protein